MSVLFLNFFFWLLATLIFGGFGRFSFLFLTFLGGWSCLLKSAEVEYLGLVMGQIDDLLNVFLLDCSGEVILHWMETNEVEVFQQSVINY